VTARSREIGKERCAVDTEAVEFELDRPALLRGDLEAPDGVLVVERPCGLWPCAQDRELRLHAWSCERGEQEDLLRELPRFDFLQVTEEGSVMVRAEDEPLRGSSLETLLDAEKEPDERRFRPVEEARREPVMTSDDGHLP
jgi:hypothetical protein